MSAAVEGAWGAVLGIAGALFIAWLLWKAAVFVARLCAFNSTLPPPIHDDRDWLADFKRYLDQ